MALPGALPVGLFVVLAAPVTPAEDPNSSRSWWSTSASAGRVGNAARPVGCRLADA